MHSSTIDRGHCNLRLYLALSRTPHGILDLATPIVAMLLWLGGFPSLGIVLLGLLTVFAGYTAVYAVNDIVDFGTDKELFPHQDTPDEHSAGYLDAVFTRHPLAKGYLSLRQAIVWATFWGVVSFIGAWLLNPVCAGLLLLGVVLETAYCKLLHVTWLRVLVNGVVKTLGPMAAVLAVDHEPAAWFMLLLFLWVFFWEVGGQNIAADWHDIELDSAQGACTVPVALGQRLASGLAITTLALSLVLSVPLFLASPLSLHPAWLLLGLPLGAWLTIVPAWRLVRTKARPQASALFNRASYYPASMLLLALLGLI